MIDDIRGIISEVARCKLGVTAVVRAAAATGAVEITLADSGNSNGVYRRADGGGHLGRVRLGTGKETGEQPISALSQFFML